MSNTSMKLGAWWRGKWPEYISVSHDGAREIGSKYVPERTCRNIGNGAIFKCSVCGATVKVCDESDEPTICVDGVADVPSYCTHCGARVEDE